MAAAVGAAAAVFWSGLIVRRLGAAEMFAEVGRIDPLAAGIDPASLLRHLLSPPPPGAAVAAAAAAATAVDGQNNLESLPAAAQAQVMQLLALLAPRLPKPGLAALLQHFDRWATTAEAGQAPPNWAARAAAPLAELAGLGGGGLAVARRERAAVSAMAEQWCGQYRRGELQSDEPGVVGSRQPPGLPLFAAAPFPGLLEPAAARGREPGPGDGLAAGIQIVELEVREQDVDGTEGGSQQQQQQQHSKTTSPYVGPDVSRTAAGDAGRKRRRLDASPAQSAVSSQNVGGSSDGDGGATAADADVGGGAATATTRRGTDSAAVATEAGGGAKSGAAAAATGAPAQEGVAPLVLPASVDATAAPTRDWSEWAAVRSFWHGLPAGVTEADLTGPRPAAPPPRWKHTHTHTPHLSCSRFPPCETALPMGRH